MYKNMIVLFLIYVDNYTCRPGVAAQRFIMGPTLEGFFGVYQGFIWAIKNTWLNWLRKRGLYYLVYWGLW